MSESVWGGTGRPSRDESERRTARFLCAVADGKDAVEAAKAAHLSPWKALRIVTESDFRDVVQAIRMGAGPVAVTLADNTGELAA